MKEKQPPISDQTLTFSFPGTRSFQLENGLSVHVIAQRELPRVYFRLGFLSGAKHFSADKAGAADLLAVTLKKGTRQRSYDEIVDTVERLGSDLNAVSSADFFIVYGKSLSFTGAETMQVLREVVGEPSFPDEQIEKERLRLLADLQNEKSSPSFLAERRLYRMIFGSHPYAVFPEEKTVQAISRDDLVQFHKRHFRPSRAILVLAGDVDLTQARQMVEESFEDWSIEGSAAPPGHILPAEPAPERRIHLVHRPGAAQATLRLGNLLFSRNHPDYEAMLVTNQILGGGASGRLFMNLREEKGYTYGAYSSLHLLRDGGLFMAQADVRPEVTGPALEIFLQELDRIRSEPVTAEELNRARRYLVGQFPLQNETPASLARLALQQLLYNLPGDYWDQYLMKLQQVTQPRVQEVASQYLWPERLQIAVVADAQQVIGQLEKLAPVSVYDVNDQPTSL